VTAGQSEVDVDLGPLSSASDRYHGPVRSSAGTGWLLLVVAGLLGGFGLWSIIRTPAQLLWGQSLVGRVNQLNNWQFNDSEGAEPSFAGKVVLRTLGLGLLVGAVVVLIIAIRLI